ncbi:MAG: radical SAM protein [Desulfocapsaceae bacterium]|nr:radical SAM protein [Desulfocapsaceae bacterium]
MRVSTSAQKSLLSPCGLDGFNYQFDPYVGCEHYCRYCYVLQQAETDWHQEIKIHSNMVEKLTEELSKIEPQRIFIGYHADPYQPIEKEYLQTRKALEILQEQGFSASILTKSDLVLRDLTLLREMGAAVSVSVAFRDNYVRSLFEENTIETEKRLLALDKLKKAGIQTGALLCPVIPYITEVGILLAELAKCADIIWIYGLSAPVDNTIDVGWNNTSQILSTHFQELAGEITSAILSRDHQYWHELRNDIKAFNEERQLDLRVHV